MMSLSKEETVVDAGLKRMLRALSRFCVVFEHRSMK